MRRPDNGDGREVRISHAFFVSVFYILLTAEAGRVCRQNFYNSMEAKKVKCPNCKKTFSIKEKKPSPPTALWHYTSFEVLTKILDVNNDCMKNRRMLSFHFGNPLQTNDSKEIHFFEEFVYKHRGGNDLKEKVEKLVKTKIGAPFILSLIHHTEKVRKYPSCEIPMWKMYGKNFSGVRLKFNYKKLKDYYQKKTDTDFVECHYLSKSKMEEKGKEIRKKDKINCPSLNLETVYKESIRYKTYDWVYENEWRIITWEKDLNQIEIRETGRSFIKQEIPLDFLEAVEIGPKADQAAMDYSLHLIKKKLEKKDDNHFKIKKSKLQIGYV